MCFFIFGKVVETALVFQKIMLLQLILAKLCHIVHCRGNVLHSLCTWKARNNECLIFKCGTLYLCYSIIAH